ncbi:response regulator [Paenibacillus endoradicis]|uniref:response regulator n=1 Tax=Paenibacillus endoradicis TaxID=2972487 RepID=UPI002158EA78|nr:response regulator [Paenibacillus endoradicis]MCR8659357.1 response regulator [Paenibacillus endoradicis]
MINVLIVDDELEIRKGLYLKIDWQELGFNIIAEAINGADAIEQLSEHSIDVVITDMNMPVMDGVGLLSYIQQHYPSIKAVVLTGYDDFAYTKAAIRHRAVEYLLKPVMPDELEHILLQIKDSIMNERREKVSSQESSRKHQRWYKEIRENFALHMLKGDLSPIILDKAPLIQMSEWNDTSIQIVTYGLLTSGRAEQFQLPFELITRELAERYVEQIIICKDSSYPNLIHMICSDGQYSRQQMLQSYKQELKQHLGFELVLGMSCKVQGFQQWYRAYMDALLQWSLQTSDIDQDTALQGQYNKLDEDVLTRLLQKDDVSAVLHYIGTIFSEAMMRSHTELVRRIFEVLIALERLLQGQKLMTHTIWLNPEQVLKLTTVDKALHYIEHYLRENRMPVKQEGNENIFKEVLSYIGQNYMYEITLPSLAEKFSYNTSYFSELFKTKVGQTFVQYVSDLRMKHACQLLETTELGLSDIAELTGFSNASYFSSRFKKTFQVAPSEYRIEKLKLKS